MYRIIHLTKNETGYETQATDYDPMTKDEAWSLVTELTNDAIDSESEDRWTIELIRSN